jgi:hypothetical protein
VTPTLAQLACINDTTYLSLLYAELSGDFSNVVKESCCQRFWEDRATNWGEAARTISTFDITGKELDHRGV